MGYTNKMWLIDWSPTTVRSVRRSHEIRTFDFSFDVCAHFPLGETVVSNIFIHVKPRTETPRCCAQTEFSFNVCVLVGVTHSLKMLLQMSVIVSSFSETFRIFCISSVETLDLLLQVHVSGNLLITLFNIIYKKTSLYVVSTLYEAWPFTLKSIIFTEFVYTI